MSQEFVVSVLWCLVIAAGLGWIGLHLRVDGRRVRTDARATWWWLRWCAMVTFLGAWAIVTVRSAGGIPFRVPSMTLFMSGVLAVSLAWFHVWFVAWPGIQVASRTPRIAAALRANLTLVVPAVFFFYASSFALQLGGGGRWIPLRYWAATIAAYGAIALVVVFLPRVLRTVLGWRPIALAAGAALIGLIAYL
ncbi:MAG: hypothetical protein KDB80_17910 [Planctomycetes bacterium]|nr:hypothetical protein [Planctomycetota bacterium]